MIGWKVEDSPLPLRGMQVTNTYRLLIEDIETRTSTAPCKNCNEPKNWTCDYVILERAKEAIRELLLLHELDQSEIVRFRRLLEMKEERRSYDLR